MYYWSSLRGSCIAGTMIGWISTIKGEFIVVLWFDFVYMSNGLCNYGQYHSLDGRGHKEIMQILIESYMP